MAKKITDEQKEQINELYCQIRVKSKVAKILGISPASVSKYIIEGYIPKEERNEEKFQGKPKEFSKEILALDDGNSIAAALIKLSSEEWAELKEMQKNIFL